MNEPRTHRITPTPIPDGADLHVEGYVRQLLADVIGVLAERPALREDLDRLLDTDPAQHDPHMPDVPSRDDQFIDDMAQALGPAALGIRMQGPELGRLAGVLSEIAAAQAPLVVRWPWGKGGEAA